VAVLTSADNLAKVDFVCSETETYINIAAKKQYGNDTETTFICVPDNSADQDRRQLSQHEIHLAAVVSTFFPREAVAPLANEYESYIYEIVTSNETMAALPTLIRSAALASGLITDRVTAETDSTVDPPELKVSLFDEEEVQGSISQGDIVSLAFSNAPSGAYLLISAVVVGLVLGY